MEYRGYAQKIMDNINSVLIGKEDKVEMALITLLAGGHLLLEDVPGIGKTTLALALARTVDVSFGRIQFTPDTLPGDVTGTSIYNMKTGEFEFSKGAVMHNIVLADEINRTSPKTQASLLEAMEERQVTVDGKTYPLEDPFMVIATQNPVDFLGTYRLPEAQMDRFMMKLSLGYPSEEDEKRMARNFLDGIQLKKLKPVIEREVLLEMIEEAQSMYIHDDVIDYAAKIVEQTRRQNNVALGCSPRALLALLRASQAAAYVAGREYTAPDDVKRMCVPVLAHRLLLAPEARINKVEQEDVMRFVIERVMVPVLPEGGRR